jgi:hypothetical protein
VPGLFSTLSSTLWNIHGLPPYSFFGPGVERNTEHHEQLVEQVDRVSRGRTGFFAVHIEDCQLLLTHMLESTHTMYNSRQGGQDSHRRFVQISCSHRNACIYTYITLQNLMSETVWRDSVPSQSKRLAPLFLSMQVKQATQSIRDTNEKTEARGERCSERSKHNETCKQHQKLNAHHSIPFHPSIKTTIKKDTAERET